MSSGSIIPKLNYLIVTRIKYDNNKKYENINYYSKPNLQKNHSAVHIISIENQIVSDIATRIKNCSSIQYIYHKYVA
jgi:hypothetical protein